MWTRGVAAAMIAATLVLAQAVPASADVPPGDPPTCDSGDQYTFLRLDPTKKYLTVDNNASATVRATGVVQGWYQAFYACYNLGEWGPGVIVFKAAFNNKFLVVDSSQVLRATGATPNQATAFNMTILWDSGDCPQNPNCTTTWAFQRQTTGLYLTGGSDSIVRANTNFIGWYQAIEKFNPWS